MIVLDANVVSEAMKPKPSARVLSWLAAYPRERLFIITITQAEILYDVQLLPAGKRAALQADIDAIFNVEFAGRILPSDEQAARPSRALQRTAAPVGAQSPNSTLRLRRLPSRVAPRWLLAMSPVSRVVA
jgi:hypothetical protein